MRRLSLGIGITSIGLTSVCLNACIYPYTSQYPALYVQDEDVVSPATQNFLASLNAPMTVSNGISPVIADNLPPFFRLRYELGTLTCVVDPEGEFAGLPPSIYTTINGSAADRVRRELDERGFQRWQSVAFPNVTCHAPPQPLAEILDNHVMPEWEEFLANWETAYLNTEGQQSAIDNLVQQYADQTSLLRQLTDNLHALEAEDAGHEQEILALDTEIANLRARITNVTSAIEGLGPTISTLATTPEFPLPFLAKIPYSYDKDFFKIVFENNSDFSNINDKEWYARTDVKSENHYMNPELAGALDKFNEFMRNPSKLNDKQLEKELTDSGLISEGGKNPFKVIAAARSIWEQAYLKAKKKRNVTKTAAYVGSEHIFGNAADFQFGGTVLDGMTNNDYEPTPKQEVAYGVLIKVLAKSGLHFIPGDVNHVELDSISSHQPNKAENLPGRIDADARRIRIMSKIKAAAQKEQDKLDAEQVFAAEEQNRLMEKYRRVNGDINNRTKELERQQAQHRGLLQRIVEKRKLKGELSEALWQKEDELAKKQAAAVGAGGSGNSGFKKDAGPGYFSMEGSRGSSGSSGSNKGGTSDGAKGGGGGGGGKSSGGGGKSSGSGGGPTIKPGKLG
jgi:hypothetical protein